MRVLIFCGALATLIILAMIRDGHRDGMLNSKKDVVEFLAFLGSMVVLGTVAWYMAIFLFPGHRQVSAIALFFVSALCIKTILGIIIHYQNGRNMRRNGVITPLEFDQRSHDILARIKSSR